MANRSVRIATLLAIAALTAAQSCDGPTMQRPQTATVTPAAQAAVCAGNLAFTSDWLAGKLEEEPGRSALLARDMGLTQAQLANRPAQYGQAAQVYAAWLRNRVGQEQANRQMQERLVRINNTARQSGVDQTAMALSRDTDRCIRDINRFR